MFWEPSERFCEFLSEFCENSTCDSIRLSLKKNLFHAQYSFWSMYRFQKVLIILIKFIWVFPNFFWILNHDKSSKAIQESFNLNVKEFLLKLWLKRYFCFNIFQNLSNALRGCKPCQPHATELLKHFFFFWANSWSKTFNNSLRNSKFLNNAWIITTPTFTEAHFLPISIFFQICFPKKSMCWKHRLSSWIYRLTAFIRNVFLKSPVHTRILNSPIRSKLLYSVTALTGEGLNF